MRPKVIKKHSHRLYETTLYFTRDTKTKGCWLSKEQPYWREGHKSEETADGADVGLDIEGGYFAGDKPMRYVTAQLFESLFGVGSIDELLMPGECMKAEFISVRMTKYGKDGKQLNIKNT